MRKSEKLASLPDKLTSGRALLNRKNFPELQQDYLRSGSDEGLDIVPT